MENSPQATVLGKVWKMQWTGLDITSFIEPGEVHGG
jgi:hypothetical protein